ncbi:MAG: DMT family transporter [Rhizobiaceae bacterium]|nr:DMT family transporter [Rhizobiaceae bacterium]
MSSQNDHLKGLILCAIGGLAITADIPLVKLAAGDAWPILMVRCAMTLLAGVCGWLIWRALDKNAPPLIPGKIGLLVAALYGISSVFFIIGVFNTSTANLVFILALNTTFSAALSWIFLKERPKNGTLLAMGAMVFGVLIIVWDSLGTGNLVGDLAGLIATLFIATAITVTRSTRKEMGMASLVGVLLPLTVSALMVSQTGYRIDAPWWIIFNGAVIMPIAFFCLATGPKYLSGPEVSMFYLLETVLAPIWVWMIFNEVPTRNSLIGGAILIIALVSHSIWQMLESRKRRTTNVVRHPA